MNNNQTKTVALAAVGVSLVTQVFAIRQLNKAEAWMKEYKRKCDKLGTVLSLFEQLAEWVDNKDPVMNHDEFLETIFDKLEFISVACKALQEEVDEQPESRK